MPDGVSEVFLERGLLGAVILVLAGAVVVLWNELRKSEQARILEMRVALEATVKTASTLQAAIDLVSKGPKR